MRNKTEGLSITIGSVNYPEKIINYIKKNENEIDFAHKDSYKGNNFLHEALVSGRGLGGGCAYDEDALMRILPELLSRNSDIINNKNDRGMTPLSLAADRHLMRVVKLLLEHGALLSNCSDPSKVESIIEISKKRFSNIEGCQEFMFWCLNQREPHAKLMQEIDQLISAQRQSLISGI